jgi:alkylation response protein AidB-like acyl-CoA dehydrogenase
MNADAASDRELLRDAVARFVAERFPFQRRQAVVRGATGRDEAFWRGLAEQLCVLGAPFPADAGGLGSFDDALVVLEELGAGLAAEPYLGTVVEAGQWLLRSDHALARERLAAIIAGEALIAVAGPAARALRRGARGGVVATAVADGFRLDGDAGLVIGAPWATDFIVIAERPDAAADERLVVGLLPAVAPGLARQDCATIDGARAALLALDGVMLPSARVLSRGAAAAALDARVADHVTVAICAEALGVMRRLVADTIDYARQRRQFGKPIADHQAIRHRIADMQVALEQSVAIVAAAVPALDDAPAARAFTVSAAKWQVGRSLCFVGESAVQVHGAIGTTDELAVGHFFKRALALARVHGTADDHRRRAESLLFGQGAPAAAAPPVAAGPDAAFRRTVRDFLAREFTPELRAAAARQSGVFATPDLARRWIAILHRQGWSAPHWPREHGGTGWTPIQRYIWDQECAEAGAPILPGMGFSMCGPVLMRFGTPEQQRRFLPRILSGEHYWCQGYSEPQAGSDLAALACRAVRDGDHYVVDGTKIWTTHAHAANWIFLLVRTASLVKPQQGITFLLCPLDTPGITIRPIRSISGEHEVNQVFFDGVRVPVENRVGDENDGWTVAKYLLEFERSGGSRAARVKSVLRRIEKLAATGVRGGEPLAADADFRRRHVELAFGQRVLEATEWRLLISQEAGRSVGDTTASLLKLRGSELMQEATTLAMDSQGEDALVDHHFGLPGMPALDGAVGWPTPRYLNNRAATIFGGSSEIQRNILARALLER